MSEGRNNNVNAGGSFIQEGLQQINVRSVGLVDRVQDIERTVIMTKNGTPLQVKDIAVVSQGPKIRLGQLRNCQDCTHWGREPHPVLSLRWRHRVRLRSGISFATSTETGEKWTSTIAARTNSVWGKVFDCNQPTVSRWHRSDNPAVRTGLA